MALIWQKGNGGSEVRVGGEEEEKLVDALALVSVCLRLPWIVRLHFGLVQPGSSVQTLFGST